MIRYYPDWNDMCETLDMNTHLPKPVKEEKEPEKMEEKEEKKEDEKEKVLSFLTRISGASIHCVWPSFCLKTLPGRGREGEREGNG